MGARHWCFCATAAAVSRSGGCLVALLGAVDGGASDTEQVGEFGGAVFTGLEQADQMCFLSGDQLGLFAAEPPLGLLGCAAGSGRTRTPRPWPTR